MDPTDHEDYVNVSSAPALPGLRFRLYRGPADVPLLWAVREGSRAYDGVDPQSSREAPPTLAEMQAYYAALPPGQPIALLAELAGQVIGYNGMTWWTEQAHGWVGLHKGWLLPAQRGRGIGSAMFRWAEDRLRAVAAEQAPSGPATFAINVSSTEHDLRRLVEAAGYRRVHNLSDMVWQAGDPLPPVPLPPSVELRPVQPDHHAAIYAAFKDAWRGTFGETAVSDADYQEFLAEHINAPHYDPSLWAVAWAEAEVVGLVIAAIRGDVGVIAEVEVRQAWQRRGIGRALLTTALTALRTREITTVRLFTDADDTQGARSLYERLGFHEVKQHGFWRKPLDRA